MSGLRETWDNLPEFVRTAVVAGACVTFGMIINDKYTVIRDGPKQIQAVLSAQQELTDRIDLLSAQLALASLNAVRLTYVEDALCTEMAKQELGPERDRWCSAMLRARDDVTRAAPANAANSPTLRR